MIQQLRPCHSFYRQGIPWIPSKRRSISDFVLSRDEARVWSRKNERLAREAMSLSNIFDLDSHKHRHSMNELEAYLRERSWTGYSNEESNESSLNHMIVLISQALTYPLTLGYHSRHFLPTTGTTHMRLAILGARSEASLTPSYWRDMLYISHRMNEKNTPLQWTLDFIGPDLAPRLASRFISLHDSQQNLKLFMTYHNTCFHQHVLDQKNTTTKSIDDQWDGYVLFNPGFGHPNLVQLWKPTLALILQSKKPILITAHSELDQKRDQRILQNMLKEFRSSHVDGSQVIYNPNPFASRMVFEDIIKVTNEDGPHFIRPNYSVCLL